MSCGGMGFCPAVTSPLYPLASSEGNQWVSLWCIPVINHTQLEQWKNPSQLLFPNQTNHLTGSSWGYRVSPKDTAKWSQGETDKNQTILLPGPPPTVVHSCTNNMQALSCSYDCHDRTVSILGSWICHLGSTHNMHQCCESLRMKASAKLTNMSIWQGLLS